MNTLIGWFSGRPAVANLLMLLILVAGLVAIPHTRQETLPNVPLDRISVVVLMPEATPAMAERLLCLPVENALYGIEGLTELISQAHEGMCSVQVDVDDGYDTAEVLERVRSQVSRIDNLPLTAQAPQVSELVVRNRVARLILSGQHSDLALYQQALMLRQRLLSTGVVSVVDVENLPDREVSLLVRRDDLRRYGLDLRDVARTVQQGSDARGSGVLRGDAGELLLETGFERSTVADFLDAPIRYQSGAQPLLLGDVARLHDGFEQQPMAAWFNGEPAVSLDIYRVGRQHVLDVAEQARLLVDEVALPQGMRLTLWQDDAATFRHRAGLLQSSALQGLAILAVVLCLFLGGRLAGWIAVGIPVAMLGAMALLPLMGESINTISLFAFILVLGIVVDDAIIVGESIDAHRRRGLAPQEAAVQGARAVSRPLMYAVLTTMLAFAPLLFLPGPEGALMRVVPLVAMTILVFSLVESLWILPAHLAPKPSRIWQRLPAAIRSPEALNARLDAWLARVYRPLMATLLQFRQLVLAGFVALFIFCLVLLHSGWLDTVLFSRVEADQVIAEVVFPQGTSPQQLRQGTEQLQQSASVVARQLADTLGESVVAHVFAEQGVRLKVSNARDPDAPYRIQVTMKLKPHPQLRATDVARQWRDTHGPVMAALSTRFDASMVQTKPDLHINLFHDDLAVLESAAAELAWTLNGYAGVHQVANSLDARRPVYELLPSQTAQNLNLDQTYLADQVRDAFHGIEVDELLEFDREIPVVLRLDHEDTATRWDLEQLPVRLVSGGVVPLANVADIGLREAPATIGHYERRRNATVTAYVDETRTQASAVMTALEQGMLAELQTRHPGLDWGIAGKPKAVAHFLSYLGNGYLLAMVAIFFLLTVLFGNYAQPVLVMSAIPFGLVGALLGHVLLGYEVTLWSMVGVVAVSGVVVNDTLVLLDHINNRLAAGDSMTVALIEGGAARFRPIMLTSVTTFVGMAPLIFDGAPESRFLVPMAVSLGFGVLFATLVSLVLVPALWMLGLDARAALLRHVRPASLASAPGDTVEDAYALGQYAARHGLGGGNPYADAVLGAAWEAGYNDNQGDLAA